MTKLNTLISNHLGDVKVALLVVVFYAAIGLEYCSFGVRYVWHRIICQRRVAVIQTKFSRDVIVLADRTER